MVRKKRPKSGPGTAPSGSSGAPMVPNGLPHGGRQALENLNRGTAPARADGAATAASGAIPGGPVPAGGLMRTPSTRPHEATTAGAAHGPGPGPTPPPTADDPDMLLRAMVAKFPHPDLIKLLHRGN